MGADRLLRRGSRPASAAARPSEARPRARTFPEAARTLVGRLGLDWPILQAPIGGAAGVDLAAAVARAGALGALALTWTSPAEAGRQVEAVRRAAPGRPFQVNFVLDFPPRALEAALAAGAPVVTFSWGIASGPLRCAQAAGARCGLQVTSARETRRALRLGADFVICQGLEAGGHVQSRVALDDLLPQVVDAADDMPVVAAGGLADGAAIARVIAMGAAGALLGTRFVATRESRAHPLYKRLLVGARADDTVLTSCFDGGWPEAPHRVLRNATLEAWEAAGRPAAGARPGEGQRIASTADGAPVLRYQDSTPRDDMSGAVEEMALYAGTSCAGVHDVPPAAELVETLMKQYLAAAPAAFAARKPPEDMG